MLIFPPSALHIDQWLKKCVCYAAVLFSAAILAALLFFFLYSGQTNGFAIQLARSSQRAEKTFFPYETIGSGALALHPRHALGWVSRLAEELVLIAYNSRPDREMMEAKILFSMKNSKEQLTLSSGTALYLKESAEGKGLQASDALTNLWIKPILLDSGAVLIEAGRKFVLKDGKMAEETGQFIVAQQGGIPAQYNPIHLECIKELKDSRSFSQDLLIQKYGGREYASWKNKVVLEISKGCSHYALFVSSGDYLQYDHGEWHLISFEEITPASPLARIKSASNQLLDIEVWDDRGFYLLPLKIEMEKPGRLQMKPEAMPSAIRLRNATQVSCAFNKRRMIIRQGDWLLKTSTGWRNLRKAEEIESYLHHRLKGELLIFDSIENEQGRSVMKGHLFDETRTQLQPLSIPIDAEKTQSKTSRKRKPLK